MSDALTYRSHHRDCTVALRSSPPLTPEKEVAERPPTTLRTAEGDALRGELREHAL